MTKFQGFLQKLDPVYDHPVRYNWTLGPRQWAMNELIGTRLCLTATGRIR